MNSGNNRSISSLNLNKTYKPNSKSQQGMLRRFVSIVLFACVVFWWPVSCEVLCRRRINNYNLNPQLTTTASYCVLTGGRLLVLGRGKKNATAPKIAAPRPLNLPSLRKETKGTVSPRDFARNFLVYPFAAVRHCVPV